MAREGLMDDTGYDVCDHWYCDDCKSCIYLKYVNYYDKNDNLVEYVNCKAYPDCTYEEKEES